uniref:Uncharacterized protein n=1 Tax=Glossina austeni TaxID=7395 RepID=A0A1A9VDE1_GLOAU
MIAILQYKYGFQAELMESQKEIKTNPKETLQQPSPRGSPRINITATENKEIRCNIGHSINALNQKSDASEQPNTNTAGSQPELLGDNVPSSMIQSLVIETLRSELSNLNINATQCQSNNVNSTIPTVSLSPNSRPHIDH